MAVSVDIPIAEMLSASVDYFAQNVRLSFPAQIGGRGLSTYGQDTRGVLNVGTSFWSGTLSISQNDRAGLAETGETESLLVRMQNHSNTWACPIIRNTDKLVTFRAIKNSQPITVDSDLFEDYLNITTAGTEHVNGNVTLVAAPVLKVADPTLSNIVAIIPQGCYLSVDGLLLMNVIENSTTTYTGLTPTKDLSRIIVGEKLYWKNPWIIARIPTGQVINMQRTNVMAGPWSVNWEEAS